MNNTYDEIMTVPPSSPQESMESVFSNKLSLKMNSTVSSSGSELHAKKLNGLLLRYKKRSNRPSRIPVLSCRIIKKKTILDNKKSIEKIVQELKKMDL